MNPTRTSLTCLVFGTGPFGAIDHKPSQLFFLLIAPNVTQHLAILARISRLLREPKLRQNLLAADSPEKVLAVIREGEEKMMTK